MTVALPKDTDLDWVQHQLNILASARTITELDPLDSLRYEELCEMEQALLERV
jgi:hypothetical protein